MQVTPPKNNKKCIYKAINSKEEAFVSNLSCLLNQRGITLLFIFGVNVMYTLFCGLVFIFYLWNAGRLNVLGVEWML